MWFKFKCLAMELDAPSPPSAAHMLLAKASSLCQSNKSAPSKAPLHPWQWPSSPWERIHLDFAGPVAGKIVTDTDSKWPEVVVMNSASSARTVTCLFDLDYLNKL